MILIRQLASEETKRFKITFISLTVYAVCTIFQKTKHSGANENTKKCSWKGTSCVNWARPLSAYFVRHNLQEIVPSLNCCLMQKIHQTILYKSAPRLEFRLIYQLWKLKTFTNADSQWLQSRSPLGIKAAALLCWRDFINFGVYILFRLRRKQKPKKLLPKKTEKKEKKVAPSLFLCTELIE